MSASLPAPVPVDPEALAVVLSGVAGAGPLLAGVGMFSPHLGLERVAVLRLRGEGPPEALWEGFLTPEALTALQAGLAARAEVWPGELDFMAATAWAYAWTVAPAPFQLWEPAGRVAWVANATLHYRYAPEGRVRTLPLTALARVEADVSPDWTVRTVRVHREDGEAPFALACVVDEFPTFDPTYDRLSLLCDAEWAVRLAAALAAGVGRPCQVHPDLRWGAG